MRLMSSIALQTQNETKSRCAAPTVVVLYEDVIAGQTGRQVADQFVSEEGCPLGEIAIWNAALIDDTIFGPFIAGQIAHAGLIVLALHDAGGLTQSLRTWIDRWTSSDGHKPRAIAVTLREAYSPGMVRICHFLKNTARRAGMEFFQHCSDLLLPGEPDGARESLWVI